MVCVVVRCCLAWQACMGNRSQPSSNGLSAVCCLSPYPIVKAFHPDLAFALSVNLLTEHPAVLGRKQMHNVQGHLTLVHLGLLASHPLPMLLHGVHVLLQPAT